MRTNARRGAHALTLVVLTAAVSLSGRVEAQQTGLFPLAPIRRQRVPCDQEDPTYKIYKHQYFGYHPTCWRTFPPGWGCPSEQAPNWEKSQKEYPVGGNREELGAPPGPEEDMGPGPMRRAAPAVPELPPERSPFDDLQNPRPEPLPRGNAPGATQPRPSPFDEPGPRGASMTPSRNRTQARSASATADENAPELSAPARQPAQGSASRSGGSDADDLADGDNSAPMLGLADSDIVRSDTSAADDPPADTAPAASSASASAAAAPAPAAQPRRRLFGNLFSSLGSNWTRR